MDLGALYIARAGTKTLPGRLENGKELDFVHESLAKTPRRHWIHLPPYQDLHRHVALNDP